MTNEEAHDVRLYLINELNKNGFSSVVSETNTRLQNNSDNIFSFERSVYILKSFLEEAITVFGIFSNNNYDKLISSINQSLTDSHIDSILVSLSFNNDETYNLKELPDYSHIIELFEEILFKIGRES